MNAGVGVRLAVVLLLMLEACTTRSLAPPAVGDPYASLTQRQADRLIVVWQRALEQHLDRQAGGDPTALTRLRGLQSRDALRPARITFGVLDVEADLPGRSGWDVQGVLVGKEALGRHIWYVFMVGIVRRDDYRPRALQDVRLVAFSARDATRRWVVGAPAPESVERYRHLFADSGAIRFPADSDQFVMSASAGRVSVTETLSGVDWSVALHEDEPGS